MMKFREVKKESELTKLVKERKREGEIEMNINILDKPVVKEIEENKGESKMEAKDYLGYLLENKKVDLDGDEKIIMDMERNRIDDEVDVNAVLYFEQANEDEVISDVLENIPEIGRIWMEKMIRLGWTLGQINARWYRKLKHDGKENITYKDMNSFYTTNTKRRKMFNEAMAQTMILKRKFEEVMWENLAENNAL